MRRSRLLGTILLGLLPAWGFAQDIEEKRRTFEPLAREMASGEPIELKALEIRARIHEPNIIYILDRTELELDYREQEISFLPRISSPILEDRF